MTDSEAERALRERAIALRDELMGLAAQAGSLFRTSGWIRAKSWKNHADEKTGH